MPPEPEATLKAMYASYGQFIDRVGLLPLNHENVPKNLAKYIPYAALWGIADDLERENRVDDSPDEAKTDLVRIVRLIDRHLDEWLSGDEAWSPTPSREYIAFSAMRMAADFIS